MHDDGVGDALGRHPLVLVEKLQARYHVVEDEGESARVDLILKQKLFHPADFLFIRIDYNLKQLIRPFLVIKKEPMIWHIVMI